MMSYSGVQRLYPLSSRHKPSSNNLGVNNNEHREIKSVYANSETSFKMKVSNVSSEWKLVSINTSNGFYSAYFEKMKPRTNLKFKC